MFDMQACLARVSASVPRAIRVLPAALFMALVYGAAPAAADVATGPAAIALMKERGHAVLMRHALAPGTGDPASFDIHECKTQRNLDDRGRAQAKAIGSRLRAGGVSFSRVLTSAWCRTKDTAKLMGMGQVEIFRPLNSFFQLPKNKAGQMIALRSFLAQAAVEKAAAPVLLVTHQVVITALTGVFPRSGELVVIKLAPNGRHTVVGRVQPK
ncbi:MAG: histidine phosphatase family protein [Pseudomonadota bacterium]